MCPCGGVAMAYPVSQSNGSTLRTTFESRLRLQFHLSQITSGARLSVYRKLDNARGEIIVTANFCLTRMRFDLSRQRNTKLQ